MDTDLFKAVKAIRGCLGLLATKDEDARRLYGQDEDEDGCLYGLVSPYALDSMKISHSKALRRLGRKTQVVSLPSNAHTRTRGSHTYEVAGSTILLRPLGLNQDLLFAAALCHDLGNVPFGHFCEEFLTKKSGMRFRHEVFGVVLAQKVERRGKGLNLTNQTLRCSVSHSRGTGGLYLLDVSEEANALMYADKISYLFADYNDMFWRGSLTGSRFKLEAYPTLAKSMDWFGRTQRERTYACFAHLCLESAEKGHVSFEYCEAAKRFAEVKDLMYQAYGSIRWDRLNHMLTGVYEFLGEIAKGADPAIMFALLTEEDVEFLYRNMTRINADMEGCLRATALGDILGSLPPTLDFSDPDLDW